MLRPGCLGCSFLCRRSRALSNTGPAVGGGDGGLGCANRCCLGFPVVKRQVMLSKLSGSGVFVFLKEFVSLLNLGTRLNKFESGQKSFLCRMCATCQRRGRFLSFLPYLPLPPLPLSKLGFIEGLGCTITTRIPGSVPALALAGHPLQSRL